MLKITVKLNVPESLRRGYIPVMDDSNYVDIDVPEDLDAASLKVIADVLDKPSRGRWSLNVEDTWLSVPEPTVAGLLEGIADTRRNVEKHKADAAARKRWKAELDAANQASMEAARAAVMATAEAQADWIQAHGSEWLRRMSAAGIEHEAAYRDERLAMERRRWKWLDDGAEGELDLPRNVPVADLDLLDEAQKDDPDAVLRYFCRDDDEDDRADTLRGYVCVATFLGRPIVSHERITLTDA